MKQVFVIIFVLISTTSLFAQRQVRKDIRKGNEAYKEQLYNAAEASYKSALEKNAASPEAIYNLANSYYKQGNWDNALKTYQQYLATENKDHQKMGAAWHNVGNTLLQKKDLKQSMEAYKKALRLNPNDEEARYNLATVQKILKDQQDNNKNKDQNKDQNKDNKDKNKDQNKDKNKDQNKDNKDKDKDKDQNKDQQNKDQKQDQQPQMSQDNIQQLLKAIEQDEKETQKKVQQIKAADRKQKNENNRRQGKDW